MTMNIGNWLSRWALYTPDKLALIDDATGRRLSYGELDTHVGRLARALQQRYGLGPQDRIAVLAHNRLETLALLFAAARLGAILVPINYRLATAEVNYIIRHCEPRLLFHGDECAALVETCRDQLPQLVSFESDDGYEALYQDIGTDPLQSREAGADYPLVILYTSGTTGRPKGAVLTHGTITWNAINTQVGWDLRRDDVTLTHTPFFHTGGLNVLTTPLLHRGGTVVLMRAFDAGRSLALIDQERCTVVFGVPTMFQMMLETGSFATADLGSVRFFITGGAPCPIPLIEAYAHRGVVFKQGYGLTEAGPNCFTLDARDAVRKAGSVGFPNMHVAVRVVDELGQDVPADRVGELLIRGPHVFPGYWRDEAATELAVQDGWLHTGDLVQLDDDGYYYIVDRRKDMFISGGENVYPAELEKLLEQHPRIREAAVIGVPHPRWGEVGLAVIVPHPGFRPAEAAVIGFLEGKVARYKLPRWMICADELPRNASGKLLKQVLRQRYGTVEPALAL